MPLDHDLVIRGANVVDGTGRAEFKGDVAVSGGIITAVGSVSGRGAEEIDGRDQIVTPGFVDIHTHYDGQVTWESRTAPSSNHGATTVLMGNCGVGFAPCRASDRDAMVHLMEGVEDVPEVVMARGIPWDWETFPEYLDSIDRRPRDINVAAQLPHSCLRVYVMGDRALAGEMATDDDLAKMRVLSGEAMRAGALGFGTSRTVFHRSSEGMPIPTKNARESELQAIADGMADAGHGVIQAVFDMEELESEFEMICNISRKSGRPASFSLAQLTRWPDQWERGLELLSAARRDGLPIKAQVLGRPSGLLLGLNLSYNPFSFYPSYQQIASLPLDKKLEIMRQPDFRRQILSEKPSGSSYESLSVLGDFDIMFPLGQDSVNYEPPAEESLSAQAAQRGVTPQEVAYDLLLANEGNNILFSIAANYVDGNLNTVLRMIQDENTLLGLGDGGAHYGMICDAGFPTFMLTYWTRDRSGAKLALKDVVKALTRDNAVAIGLDDRGIIAPGYRADLNLIDMNKLKLHAPRVAFDLPAGGRRLTQAADGYTATIVNGRIMQRDGTPTSSLAGKLVRGPQSPVRLEGSFRQAGG